MINNTNYLTSFKVQLIKHVKSTFNFIATNSYDNKTINNEVNKLLEKAIPMDPVSFDWFRTILQYVCDKEQWLVYDNTTGIWHYEASDSQIRSLLCDYFQTIYDYAVDAGDEIHRKYAACFFQNANKLNTLVKRLSGGIQFKQATASGLVDKTFNIRYFDTCDSSGVVNGRCIIDMSKDTFNIAKVKFNDTQSLMLQHKAPIPMYMPGDDDTDTDPTYWLSLIDQYMLNDPDKIEYFKDVLGYMCSPYNYNQVLLYWLGQEGRNGKSTVLKVLQDILGPYSARLNSDLINANPSPSFKKDDALASTEGRSLLIFNEIDERMVASTQNIKDLTEGGRDEFGNKVMTVVRPAYSKNYEINICGTPLIVANSLINMGDWSNLAPIFRRLILVSFDFKIVKEDPTVLNKLANEYPKIQLWLYKNYFRFKQKCLLNNLTLKSIVPPADWVKLFNQYYSDSDIIKTFWNDCIDTSPKAATESLSKPLLYKMYVKYCQVNGRKPIKNKGNSGFSQLIAPYLNSAPCNIVLSQGYYVVRGITRSSYYVNEVEQA